MPRSTIWLAPLLAGAIATTASAQADTAEQADIECLAATIVLSNAEDGDLASAGTAGMMYFLGKLAARGTDFARRLEQAINAMSDAEIGETGMRCGDEITAMGELLQRAADEMEP